MVWPSEIPSEYILSANYQISRPKLLITRNTTKFKWKNIFRSQTEFGLYRWYESMVSTVGTDWWFWRWYGSLVRTDGTDRWFGQLARAVSADRWYGLSAQTIGRTVGASSWRLSTLTVNTDRLCSKVEKNHPEFKNEQKVLQIIRMKNKSKQKRR